MDRNSNRDQFDTIVIGGGQAGLATGYYLKRHGIDFIILDANQRTGDSWRQRWDSLRLFSEWQHNWLPGMRPSASARSFPTKDEMGDYLEAYEQHFDLPIRHGVRVDRLSRAGERFVIEAGGARFEANNVVVAMGKYQEPKVPEMARELRAGIRQMHSSEYRNPGQFQGGAVLVVGAGNSGAEIALEAAREHPTYLAGEYPGYLPFRIETVASRYIFAPMIVGLLFHHLFTVDTPFGRRMRPKVLREAGPLIRTKPSDVKAAGAERVARVEGIRDGRPLLADNRVLDVANVVWCTGFHAGFSWIDLPIFNEHEEPRHERGVVADVPGLYFTGLPFLYAFSSSMVHGAGRDARHVVKALAARQKAASKTQSLKSGRVLATAGSEKAG